MLLQHRIYVVQRFMVMGSWPFCSFISQAYFGCAEYSMRSMVAI
jgi:hypothetical protein